MGFEVANFIVKQNESRYSRDIIYGNDAMNLSFYAASLELSDIEQVQDIHGQSSYYLDNGLNWILETYNHFGFEGKIEYILKKEGVLFTTGLLDMANPDTDGNTYFACSIIQSNQIADYKKHEETVIDLFSTKNAKNETITPAETFKFLRKAVPVLLTSEMRCPAIFDKNLRATSDFADHTNYYYYNNALNTVSSEISNTMTLTKDWVSHDFNTTDDDVAEIFTIAQAKRQLKDFKLSFTNFIFNQRTTVSGGGNGYADTQLVIRWGVDINIPIGEHIPFSCFLNEDLSYTNPIHDFSFTIPFLPIDAKVWVFMKTKTRQSASPIVGRANFNAYTSLSQYNLDISASSFSLDTVVKGVRYIDMMKQCSKFINDLPIVAPRFNVGGEFYDQVCYNRALISQNILKPFNTSFNDILGSTQEVNGDFEIMHDKIFQGQYPDFYENSEIGVFEILPSESYKESWSDRFKINLFSFGYKTFEQNRLTANTTGDVHTNSEWIIPNLMVENKKEVAINLIRSAFSQQVAVDLEIKTPQTADENDDKVYIVDIIPLPAGTAKEFSANLQMQITNFQLTIFNKKSGATVEDAVINWAVLGFNIGDVFQITDGQNIGNYTVYSISQTMLVLNPGGVSLPPNYVGDAYITMKFTFMDVLWQTRTDEDFIGSGNTNLKNYPNLKYTIRRNMAHWESFISTACSFNTSKSIRNSYFKNDPALVTQFQNGTTYTEKADIPVENLKAPIITPKMFDITVMASFGQIITLLETLKTVRGFIRSFDLEGKILKGYIKDLDYTWTTNELKLILEEKTENEILTVNYLNGVFSVNDVVYSLSGNLNWWKMSDAYFTAFDANNIPICNKYHYDKVYLNGEFYHSEYDLTQALKNL